MSGPRRIALLGAVLVSALLAPASALAAGSVTLNMSGNVIYTGDATANVVTFGDADMGPLVQVTIGEAAISESPDVPNCTDNGNNVSCDINPALFVEANFGAGNDIGTVNGSRLAYRLNGQDDNDELTGSDSFVPFYAQFPGFATDFLSGGPGVDVLIGRNGVDGLQGGPGDGDTVDGGPGPDRVTVVAVADGTGDTLRGGTGVDTLHLAGLGLDTPGFTVNLAMGTLSRAESPESHLLESLEDVRASGSDDVLIGNDGSNILEGSEGNDRIEGLLGSDLLRGGLGEDTMLAQDEIGDRVAAGGGNDTCAIDRLDEPFDCELLQPNFPPPDQAGPVCSTPGLPGSIKRRRLFRGGVSVAVACDEGGQIDALLTGRLRRLRRGSRIAAAGDITLGVASATLGAGNQAQVRLRVARRLRRSIARRARLGVVVIATDALGNASKLTRTLRLR